MSRFSILILILNLIFHSGTAQESNKKVGLLSEGFYFDPLIYDPAESLTGAGTLWLWESNEAVPGIYIPVNIAFGQSLIRYKVDSLIGWEFGLQAAAFTQFEIKKVEDGVYLGGMMNVDYRATGFINYLHHRFSMRFRLFHISSHLADDYIFRNEITTPTPNTVNYEQIDFTASFQQGPIRYYAGLGYIFTPNSIRDRFSSEVGFQFRQIAREDDFIRLIFGLDVKIFEENSYTPGFRGGLGIEMGQSNKTHLAFLADVYHGHLPYSTLEYRQVTWFGISSLVLPKRRK
jgi:hypothetical protein